MIISNSISSNIEYRTSHEECFSLSKKLLNSLSGWLYITGKIHNKYSWFFLENEKG